MLLLVSLSRQIIIVNEMQKKKKKNVATTSIEKHDNKYQIR